MSALIKVHRWPLHWQILLGLLIGAGVGFALGVWGIDQSVDHDRLALPKSGREDSVLSTNMHDNTAGQFGGFDNRLCIVRRSSRRVGQPERQREQQA